MTNTASAVVTASTVVSSLIASGPFWAAVIPAVTSITKGTIDLISEWRRDRANRRYQATFHRLVGVEALLFARIKDCMALIEACDEIASHAEQRWARNWTWSITFILMFITGFKTLPFADMLDPIIAIFGGAWAPWLGTVFARFTNIAAHVGSKELHAADASSAPLGVATQPDQPSVRWSSSAARMRYAYARERAMGNLIDILSSEILKKASIPEAEIGNIREEYAQPGWKNTRTAVLTPWQATLRYLGW